MRRLNGQRNERGAALVESALVFLPLCLILFGILEYGFIFKDSLTLSSATRAGARTASASPHASGFYTATADSVTKAAMAAKFKVGDELKIYVAPADGTPPAVCDATIPGNTCVKYIWNGTTFALNPTGQAGPAAALINAQQSCLSSAQSVGVALTLHHDSISGIIPKPLVLDEHTVMRLEPDDQNC